MQTLSKDQVALRLQAPNGAAALMEQAEAALDGALALFLEDQDPAACGFLCRCAKSNRLRQRIQAALSVHPEALGQALFAPAPKLRKNAARLLGLLGAPAHVPMLIQALKQESQRFVRPSQLLALGALGGPEAQAFLAAYQPAPAADPSEQTHVQAEAEALATARRALLHLQKHSFTSLPFPVEAELRAPDRLAHTLAAELTGLGYAPAAVHADRVRLHTQDLPGLFRARRFFELLLPLSENLPMAPGVLGDRAGEQLTKLLPACHAGEGPFGYRIELKAKNLDRGAFARAMAARLDGPLLANAPGTMRWNCGWNSGIMAKPSSTPSYLPSRTPVSPTGSRPCPPVCIPPPRRLSWAWPPPICGKTPGCWTPAAAAAPSCWNGVF